MVQQSPRRLRSGAGSFAQHEMYWLVGRVGYATCLDEVAALMREWHIPTIMGSHEGVGNGSPDGGCARTEPEDEAHGKQPIARTNAHTNDDDKASLRTLVRQIPLTLGDVRVILVHGSPRRINEYVFADRPDRSFARLVDRVEADVLVCGHPHRPAHTVLPSGRHVVNAGSVGTPKDAARAPAAYSLKPLGALCAWNVPAVP